MAPEIFEGDKVTSKSDVYAYSIILYQLLTGIQPYKRINMYELMSQVTRGIRPSILEDECPSIYVSLIQACWNQNPDDRPSSIQIVKEFIDRKDEFFDFSIIDEDAFEYYVDQAIHGLDFTLS